MAVFEDVGEEDKQLIVNIWKKMSESEKTHFINQVSLALSVWGSDELGKKAVVDVLLKLIKDGSNNLCDFGLYINKIYEKKDFEARTAKIKRAALIIESYRAKNALSSEPHKELGV